MQYVGRLLCAGMITLLGSGCGVGSMLPTDGPDGPARAAPETPASREPKPTKPAGPTTPPAGGPAGQEIPPAPPPAPPPATFAERYAFLGRVERAADGNSVRFGFVSTKVSATFTGTSL